MAIDLKKTFLGIELGSTRIKAILIDHSQKTIAQGAYDWENKLENNLWTYHLDDIWQGVQGCFSDLKKDFEQKYNQKLNTLGALGVSAMMHGYMAFDKSGNLLVPFRTWRNTNARDASAKLTKLFNFNIPERWSIAHLYQCVLNKEEHVKDIAYFTTLAGYIHWKLTGEKVLGIGDAVGMFPIEPKSFDYNENYIDLFNKEIKAQNAPLVDLKLLLPKVLKAGDKAGVLTCDGAKLLDSSGQLEGNIPMCPPEGDAGTGMVATNACAKRTGNISAGTSIFAMVVLENHLKNLYREIDMVTTPDGSPVAMVHANNCTSDLNAWVSLFSEFAKEAKINLSTNELYALLYNKALEGDADCSGMMAYGYYSGEFITNIEEGRPLFIRKPESKFNLANFMRTNLYTTVGALKIGMNILKDENVKIDKLFGHGGLFKTPKVGQSIVANALNTPISVMQTAGEGGPWGMAVLASYLKYKDSMSLPQYLENIVFKDTNVTTINPNEKDVEGYDKFMHSYINCLSVEKEAVKRL